MDEPASPQATIPKMRTYAADLEAVRARRGDAPAPSAPVVPQAAAVAAPPAPTAPRPVSAVATVPPPPASAQATSPDDRAPEPPPEAPLTSNPPFHRIVKRPAKAAVDLDARDVAQVGTTEQRSLLTSQHHQSFAIDGSEDAGDATLITDRRRRSFRFFPAIARALSDWWADFRDAHLVKKPPKYTVASAHRRKGVITEQTVSTGKTHVDHAALVARIKRGEVSAQEEAGEDEVGEGAGRLVAPNRLLEAPDEGAAPTPSATAVAEARRTHANEASAALAAREAALRAREAELAAEAKRLDTARQDAAAEATRLREEALAAASAEASAQRDQAAADATAAAAAAAALEADAAAARRDAEAEALEVEAAAQATYNARVEEGGAPELIPRSALRAQLKDTTSASLVTVVGLIVVVAVIFGGRALYTALTAPPIAVNLGVTSTLTPSTGLPLSEAANLRTTLEAADTRTFERYFTTETADGLALASPVAVADTLGWGADQRFLRSLRQVSVGAYERTPLIIMHTTDYETALGGMLAWETAMAADLAPLLGTPPSAREVRFADASVAGVDARILTVDGLDVLAYAFLADTTLIITTSPRTLEAIASGLE